MSAARHPARGRDVVLAWLVPLALLGALAVIVGGLGGFRTAVVRGEQVAPEAPVRLARWEITVRSAAVVDQALDESYQTEPTVRLWLRLVNVTAQSLYAPATGTLVALFPDGTAHEATLWRAPDREGDFDPDVPLDVYLEWKLAAPWASGKVLRVRLFDEEPSPGLLFADTWRFTGEAARIDVPCPDRRTK